mmetsp:Transcript_27727/g.52183  ORF Transcript_27727/g.52183 Transcript_27727/m.52183 type:complete len:83 (-) Transcript_27727:9-257(-)
MHCWLPERSVCHTDLRANGALASSRNGRRRTATRMGSTRACRVGRRVFPLLVGAGVPLKPPELICTPLRRPGDGTALSYSIM